MREISLAAAAVVVAAVPESDDPPPPHAAKEPAIADVRTSAMIFFFIKISSSFPCTYPCLDKTSIVKLHRKIFAQSTFIFAH